MTVFCLALLSNSWQFLQAEKEKATPLDDLIAAAILKARLPYYGSPRQEDVQYVFGYISGDRIKVRYLPQGLLPGHKRLALKPYDGKPILASNAFDVMYGYSD